MDSPDVKPLIAESSTSESTTVEVVMNDLRDEILTIPDYQRDSDQWDETTKSLFVESIINNLSIPAFFFEVIVDQSVEKNQVIDGQQRLTTLRSYYENDFSLVESEEAPYLSPHSVHYAGKKFKELPLPYQQAFKKYRLTTIKLRNLGEMRLEVFRRINQGGTPLSGQDIRLAYYGEKSPTLAMVRLAGVYEPDRQASRRFIQSAKQNFGIEFPWRDPAALETWKDWWAEKDIAKGQTAAEMFLWSLVAAQPDQLDSLLSNTAALQKLNCRYNKAIDEVLDVYCAQVRFQDADKTLPPVVMQYEVVRDEFFPHFANWIDTLLRKKGASLNTQKHRVIASVIGAAFRLGLSKQTLTDPQWANVVEFIRRPQDFAKSFDISWPMSKGRWDGKRGYRIQMQAAYSLLEKIMK